MIQTIRTDSDHPDFMALVKKLDAELAERDGTEHSFYDQFNKIVNLEQVVVLYENDKPVSCGALKEVAPRKMEVKRMYTEPAHRGKGLAAFVLKELETWAHELAYETCVLETGKRQPEAIRLYEKAGYKKIPNYGQYVGVENSVCFEKILA
jgi:putative acetyltransferase